MCFFDISASKCCLMNMPNLAEFVAKYQNEARVDGFADPFAVSIIYLSYSLHVLLSILVYFMMKDACYSNIVLRTETPL